MKHSKKIRNRREVRRRRQLRERHERIISRQDKKYVPEEFTLRLFLKRHKIEIGLIIVIITGVLAVISIGPDKNAGMKLRNSVSSSLLDRSQQWAQEYPNGYKIIVLTDTDIIHTSFDTLSEDLKINWKDMSVARIQANQLTNMDEKIKIRIRGIDYAPAGVSDLMITTAFSRKKGIITRLARLGELEFVAEIVEDNEDGLFCLLGLRER